MDAIRRWIRSLRRANSAYTARSPRAPQDQPMLDQARMRRWFSTGEIRRNRRESW